ncbi:MAG: nucleotidyl transferase AbiEii/AbiGii toxin family protein [Rhodocyclaceae bacterium]|nr:MAG: nucleotidyl transferase AbiEii/AbiGii toxin family protein [Rhodocyclaceae bacterium]
MKKEDFAQYVEMALNNTDLATMRPVVEKELMHYEIFNALDEEGLLKNLVFQGGTSLRLCRGSDRFSEDLDFAGGKDFSSTSMEKIKDCIIKRIGARFGLKVAVKEPKPAKKGARVNVDKWMVSIETSPGEPDVPRQKIKLEIANIPAYTREAVPLRMNYSVLDGMNRVIVVAETIDEILADKVVALPTSIAKLEGGGLIPTPTKIRHRDIWDIAWLVEQGAKLDPHMVKAKIEDYGIQNYEQLLDHAIQAVPGIASGAEFKAQMQRFIRKRSHDNAFGKPGFDAYLSNTVTRLFNETKLTLTVQPPAPTQVEPRTRRV